MGEYAFVTLDVFTSRPFGGNPLAVFPDGRGLDGATMQAIATEFNLSETVFMLPPPDGSEAIATVRIFTPVAELPFTGHPSVGAAYYVASNGGIFGRDAGDGFVFDENLDEPGVLFATGADELTAVEILGSDAVERVTVYDATVGGEGSVLRP